MAESQKEKLMRLLGCTETEADDIIASDKAIDRGEKVAFDLTPEQQREVKKYRAVGTRKTDKTQPSERKRKENPTKATVIAEIAQFLTENGYESVEIINKERQIAFKVGENSYEFTLVQKRKPKN